jgi:hypothetical protein
MPAAMLTLILLTGGVSACPTSARPTPGEQAFCVEPHPSEPNWAEKLLRRCWPQRYTIKQGTHFVRPRDYRRAFDYPWHAPRGGWPCDPQGRASSGDLPPHHLPPPVLPRGEAVYPDPEIGPLP